MYQPELVRRAAFARLVFLQDRGWAVEEARGFVARNFGLRPFEVVEVEEEGIRKDWPLEAPDGWREEVWPNRYGFSSRQRLAPA